MPGPSQQPGAAPGPPASGSLVPSLPGPGCPVSGSPAPACFVPDSAGPGSPGSSGLAGGSPESAAQAVSMVLAGLRWLTTADLASAPQVVQAECLLGLEQARSVHTAAHAAALSAFDYGDGYEADGQPTARSWLRWRTRVTAGAASGASGWMRRLRAHPEIWAALAAGEISESWAKDICAWTDLLPESARADADRILLAAAAGGARLTDLAGLAEEMRQRLAAPDTDGDDDGFTDRRLRLATTLGGAGKLDGDLTPGCAEAMRAVLDALGKRRGPEDLRTPGQRRHDALEEALVRLIAAGGLPDRAGQPTQIQLHLSLDDLTRRLDGTPDNDENEHDGTGQAGHGNGATRQARTGQDDAGQDDAGADSSGHGGTGQDGGGQAGGGQPGGQDLLSSRLRPRLQPDGSTVPPALPWPAAAPGTECDATIIPVLTGHLDHDLLDKLTALLTRPVTGPGSGTPGTSTCDHCGTGYGPATQDQAYEQIRDLIAANAVALLSGPHGLASFLRTGRLARPAASVSLPLDVGTSTDTIPAHLRRAVILRDQHCAAPGCTAPPSSCQVHHIRPRSKGGATSLINMVLLCGFHHLILIHRWGWSIVLNPDGTTTMTCPDRSRVYHSHSPPAPATAA